ALGPQQALVLDRRDEMPQPLVELDEKEAREGGAGIDQPVERLAGHHRDPAASKGDHVVAPRLVLEHRALPEPAPGGHPGERHRAAVGRVDRDLDEPLDHAEPSLDGRAAGGKHLAGGDVAHDGLGEDALPLAGLEPWPPVRFVEHLLQVLHHRRRPASRESRRPKLSRRRQLYRATTARLGAARAAYSRGAVRNMRKYPRQPACAKLAGAPSTRGLDIGGGHMAGSDAAAQVAGLGETTFPRLLARHAAARPDATAMREKDLGIWQAMTWAELKAEVELVAAGLAAAGFERGMKLALVGENRPRLYIGMIAAQVLGGVTVPLYQDAVAQEMVYVFRDAGIAFAIVEDQEQVDKLLEVKTEYPELRRVWYD